MGRLDPLALKVVSTFLGDAGLRRSFDLFDRLRLSKYHGMTALCVFPLTDVDSLHEGRLLSSFLLGKKFLGGIFFSDTATRDTGPSKNFLGY